MKYLFFGMTIGYLGATSNHLLFFKFPFPPVGNILVLLYIVTAAYVIIKHQFLDIDVIIKKTLVFAGLLASVFAMLILPTLIIQEYLARSAGYGGKLIGITISGIIIILTMRRIENFLINITDKYLFQKKYDYKELLKMFTGEVLTVLSLEKLVNLTVDRLVNSIKLDSCSVLLFDDQKQQFHVRAWHNIKDPSIVLSRSDAIVEVMNETLGHISVKDLEQKNVSISAPTKDMIDRLSAKLIIPMVLHGEVIGILTLGKKKSDEDYTQDDFDILLPLAKTLAIAISNAKLFEELGKTQAEAAQKEKMAMIGTLAAGMAHEIRNPIMTIRTFADYLPERYADEDFVKTFNRIIPGEIEKVDNIAYSLLEFSGVEDRVTDENVDLRDVIRIVMSILEPQYKFSGIKVSLADKYSGAIATRANKREIQGAFFNIIKYAMSETPKGSEVLVEMSREDDKSVWVSIKAKNINVAEHVIKDVFEPMSRLYKEKRGFGFNLFIARQLLERNGGVLTIRSDGEMGSEFKICFKCVSV